MKLKAAIITALIVFGIIGFVYFIVIYELSVIALFLGLFIIGMLCMIWTIYLDIYERLDTRLYEQDREKWRKIHGIEE